MKFTIRKTIIAAMQSRELSAYALAKLAEVDPGVVSRYVTGKREVQTDTLEKMLNALGLTVGYADD